MCIRDRSISVQWRESPFGYNPQDTNLWLWKTVTTKKRRKIDQYRRAKDSNLWNEIQSIHEKEQQNDIQ